MARPQITEILWTGSSMPQSNNSPTITLSRKTDLYVRLREETYRIMQCRRCRSTSSKGASFKCCRLSSAKSILELGMFTGYSALMMAEALPDNGHLITCEIDPKAEAIARRYFAESPHRDKITIRMGPALDTIRR